MPNLANRQLDTPFSKFNHSIELTLSGFVVLRVLRWLVVFSAPAEAWAANTAPNKVGIWHHLGCQLELLSGYPIEFWDRPRAAKHVRESKYHHKTTPKSANERIRNSRKQPESSCMTDFSVSNIQSYHSVTPGPRDKPQTWFSMGNLNIENRKKDSKFVMLLVWFPDISIWEK